MISLPLRIGVPDLKLAAYPAANSEMTPPMKRILFAALIALALLVNAPGQVQEKPSFTRTEDVIITSNLPPTLIIHGDADKLVPMQQAESFVTKAQEVGAKARLIVKEGQAHGWPDMGRDATKLADWFDEHLRNLKPAAGTPK